MLPVAIGWARGITDLTQLCIGCSHAGDFIWENSVLKLTARSAQAGLDPMLP